MSIVSRCRYAVLACLLAQLPVAQSQSAAVPSTYPSEPVRMIVGWPAGGASDTVARVIANAMGESLGQQIVVDNRPGASSNIGSELAARAKPDGYTIMLATGGSHGVNSALYRKLNFDPIKDFAPIGMISTSSSILVVPANSPYQTLGQLLAKARAQPRQLNYGTAGNGSSGHMATTMLQQRAGIEVTHIPYKGGAPAMTDLMGGQLDFMLDSGVIPLVKSGKLRALAIAAPHRLAALSNVPTFAEAGVASMETNWWTGLVAPAGTPRPVLERLHNALDVALSSPDVQRRLLEFGAVADRRGLDDFWSYVQQQMPEVAAMVKATGAQLD
ncbi:MAG: tripartite tricarboxylate transporter substrate binding protein [Pseudomonadota bacterium]